MKKKLTELVFCAVLIGGVMAAGAWFTEGILRVILLAVLYFAEMELLSSLVRLALGEPEAQKMTKEEQARADAQWYLEPQDPAVLARLRPVGIALHVAAFLLLLLNIANVGSYRFHSVACLVCSGVSVILCAVFPAYFSLSYGEKEKGRAATIPVVNLLLAAVLPLAAGEIGAILRFHFTDWLGIAEVTLVLLAALGLVLRLAIPELRRHRSNWLGVMVLALFFSLGLTAPLNYLLDQPPRTVTAVVTDYDPGGYRDAADYTFLLENGEEINLTANTAGVSRGYRIGEEVTLEYHQGGLGIPYYSYSD